jgi:hypothetical protein
MASAVELPWGPFVFSPSPSLHRQSLNLKTRCRRRDATPNARPASVYLPKREGALMPRSSSPPSPNRRLPRSRKSWCWELNMPRRYILLSMVIQAPHRVGKFGTELADPISST